MATYKRPLIDKQNNTIHPITCTKAVYDDNGVELDEILNYVRYRMILTSNNTAISRSTPNITITAKIMNGNDDITSQFNNSKYKFRWTRTSNDSTADATWNSRSHTYPSYNSISIGTADVLYSATFTCELCSLDQQQHVVSVISTAQVQILDLIDRGVLNGYISSNLPRVQVHDTIVDEYNPDYTKNNLVLTPSVYLDNVPIALNNANLTLVWKKRINNGAETDISSQDGETVSDGILTVSKNVLSNTVTYIIYVLHITYTDPVEGYSITTDASTDISYVTAGEIGNPSVIFSLYAPYGTVFENGTGDKVIQSSAFYGPIDITNSATYRWYIYVNGDYSLIQDATSSSYTVHGSDVQSQATFKCIMTYQEIDYTDVMTLTDKTDNYQTVIDSTTGDIFKNSNGDTCLVANIYQNGVLVDELKCDDYDKFSKNIPYTPPYQSGQMYHKIQDNSPNMPLMRYDGVTWVDVTNDPDYKYAKTYTWYRRDENGDPMDNGNPYATGKVIHTSYNPNTSKITFTCEVTDIRNGSTELISTGNYTITSIIDPIISNSDPSNPFEGMLWIDTSVTPNILKIYKIIDNVGTWIAVGASDEDKNKVFTTPTPFTPYRVGDLWLKTESNGDKVIYYCTTAKESGDYSESDWILSNNYQTPSEVTQEFNNFTTTIINPLVARVDHKIETWVGTSDPEPNWYNTSATPPLDERNLHIGDLWYDNTANAVKLSRYDKTSTSPLKYGWTEIKDQTAIDAFNGLDEKITSYYQSSQPSGGTYVPGDLWIDTGDNNKLYRYNGTSWVNASDNSLLNSFITTTFTQTVTELRQNIDDKIETWFQTTDPSVSWYDNTMTPPTDNRPNHIGDIWYNNTPNNVKLQRYHYNSTKGKYEWEEITNQTAIDAFNGLDYKITTYCQDSEPSGGTYVNGDLWIDTSDNNNLYRYDGSAWVDVADESLDVFISGDYATDIQGLQDQIDGKIESWFQTTDPSLSWTDSDKSYHVGDIWYDNTNNDAHLYRYYKKTSNPDTYDWIEISDQTAIDALDGLDHKITTYCQNDPPTGGTYVDGDLWIDTNDNNKLYRYNGSSWIAVSDNSLLNGFITSTYNPTVEELQQNIDKKVETWFQTTDPSGSWYDGTTIPPTDNRFLHIGDLWYDNTTNNVKLKRYYKKSSNPDTYDWQEIKNQDAINALATKISTYVQSSQPTGGTYVDGDLWIDSDDNNNLYRYNGTTKQWVDVSNGSLAQFINGEYANDIENIQDSLDGKIETWFQTSDPSSNWYKPSDNPPVDDREIHIGDLWYDNTTNDVKLSRYYKKNTNPLEYDWQEINNQTAINAMNFKITTYSQNDTPTGGTYVDGDLWIETDNDNKLYRYNSSTQEWVAVSDGSLLNSFITNTYTPVVLGLQSAIDSKIETWYQDFDPSTHAGIVSITTSRDAITAIMDNAGAVTFRSQIDNTTGTYVFTRSGSSWLLNGSAVTLSNYGISTTGTPANGDTITVVYQKQDEDIPWNSDTKAKHIGDMWYSNNLNNTGRVSLKRYSFHLPSIYQWDEITNQKAIDAYTLAESAEDLADSKRRVFYDVPPDTPTPPYEVGDLWSQGSNGSILVCVNARETGNYVATDWGDSSRYDDFIDVTYMQDKETLQSQIDGKIQTWFQDLDPESNAGVVSLTVSKKGLSVGIDSPTFRAKVNNTTGTYVFTYGSSWNPNIGAYGIQVTQGTPTSGTTITVKYQSQEDSIPWSTAVKSKHEGDLWYSPSNKLLKRYDNSGNVYSWSLIQDSDAIQALQDAEDAQTTADGKCQTFYTFDTLNCVASSGLTASIVEYEWRNYVLQTSGTQTYVFTYNSNAWKLNGSTVDLDNYGIRLTGTPVNGSTITVTYEVGTPTVPYDIGDLWVQGNGGDILVCITAKETGSFNRNDWDYGNALHEFVNVTYKEDIVNLEGLIDSKVDNWFQTSDPATAWVGDDIKDAHIGDSWYKDSTHMYRYSESHTWVQYNNTNDPPRSGQTNGPIRLALIAAASAHDTVDGRRRIFIGTNTPTPPYDNGDIWMQGSGGDILYCNNAKTSDPGQKYERSDWVDASKYQDYQIVSGTTVPSDTNKMWLDTTAPSDPVLKKFDTTTETWVPVGGAVKFYTDAPPNYPNTPYNSGDVWVYIDSDTGETVMKICHTSKLASESYSEDDWAISNNDIIINSDQDPSDTSKLWYNTTNNRLYMYDPIYAEWKDIGAVSENSQSIQNITEILTVMQRNMTRVLQSTQKLDITSSNSGVIPVLDTDTWTSGDETWISSGGTSGKAPSPYVEVYGEYIYYYGDNMIPITGTSDSDVTLDMTFAYGDTWNLRNRTNDSVSVSMYNGESILPGYPITVNSGSTSQITLQSNATQIKVHFNSSGICSIGNVSSDASVSTIGWRKRFLNNSLVGTSGTQSELENNEYITYTISTGSSLNEGDTFTLSNYNASTSLGFVVSDYQNKYETLNGQVGELIDEVTELSTGFEFQSDGLHVFDGKSQSQTATRSEVVIGSNSISFNTNGVTNMSFQNNGDSDANVTAPTITVQQILTVLNTLQLGDYKIDCSQTSGEGGISLYYIGSQS